MKFVYIAYSANAVCTQLLAGEGPYKYELYLNSFTSSSYGSYLRAHKRLHNSANLSMCDACSNSFSYRVYLDLPSLLRPA